MPAFYGAIDLVKNELRNAVIQNLGSAPATPLKGQIYFDSTANILYWYNGTQWIAAQAAAGAIPSDTVSTQAVGDAAVPGSSTLYSRGDHKHAREAFGVISAETSYGITKSDGFASTVARSDHTHGSIPTHAIGDHPYRLDQWSAPTASVNMNNQRLVGLADPTTGTDGANKNYVDGLSQGLSWKDSVRAATTANITQSGPQTVDGVPCIAGDRVLVKDNPTVAQNGIYVVAAGSWPRATDADTGTEVEGMAMFVMEGTVNADTAWVCTTNAPITVGSTALTFVQFAGGGAVVGGAGLTQSGNTLNVVAGDTSITVAADDIRVNTSVIASQAFVTGGYQPLDSDLTALANLSGTGFVVRTGVGTQQTRLITSAAPIGIVNGTGVSGDVVVSVTNFTSGAAGTVPASGGGTTTFLRADGTWAAPVGGVVKYAAALTGTASPEVITHNLNTRDIHLTVYNGATPYTAVEVDWDATTVNTATIRYNPNLGAGYRVVILG